MLPTLDAEIEKDAAAFLRDGIKGGYEPALLKHYGIQNYRDLEKRWAAYALKDNGQVAERGK